MKIKYKVWYIKPEYIKPKCIETVCSDQSFSCYCTVWQERFPVSVPSTAELQQSVREVAPLSVTV